MSDDRDDYRMPADFTPPPEPQEPLPSGEPGAGRVMVYGTGGMVAASRLVALLQEAGIEAVALNRPDVYFGAWGCTFPDTYQVLVWEQDVDQRAAEIDAAIAELEAELAEEPPSDEPDDDEPPPEASEG